MKEVGDVVVIVECNVSDEGNSKRKSYFTNLIYGRYVLGTLQSVTKDSLKAVGDDGKIYQTTVKGGESTYKFLEVSEAYKCFNAEIEAVTEKLGKTKMAVRKFGESIEKHKLKKRKDTFF